MTILPIAHEPTMQLARFHSYYNPIINTCQLSTVLASGSDTRECGKQLKRDWFLESSRMHQIWLHLHSGGALRVTVIQGNFRP